MAVVYFIVKCSIHYMPSSSCIPLSLHVFLYVKVKSWIDFKSPGSKSFVISYNLQTILNTGSILRKIFSVSRSVVFETVRIKVKHSTESVIYEIKTRITV